MRWSHAPGRQLANRLRIDAWLAAFINASRLGCRDALRLALLAQVRLELCEHPQHVKERLAGGRRRIDRLLGSLERYAPALQLVDDVLQILHRARQPVDTRDDQGVAFAQEVEQDLQLGPPAAIRA